MGIESIRKMASRLIGRTVVADHGSEIGEWDAEYVEKVFLDKVTAFLEDNGYVRTSELRWFCVDPPCSITVAKTYYKGLGDSFYDRATFTVEGKGKDLYWPMPPTGDIDNVGYLNHLDAMCDDLLARAVAMKRGMIEEIEGLGEVSQYYAEDVNVGGEPLEEAKKGFPSDQIFLKALRLNNYAKAHGIYPSEVASAYDVSEKEAVAYLDQWVERGNLTREERAGKLIYKSVDSQHHKPSSVPMPKKDSRSRRLRGLDKIREVAAQKRAGGGRTQERINDPGSLWDGAEVVLRYSRKQAIRDGELVDVTKQAKEGGFKWPTAFTRSLWNVVSRIPKSSSDDLSGRLHDIFSVMKFKIRGGGTGSHMRFKVKIGNKNHDLMSVVGPGDTPAPVITVGYPQDF